MRTSGIGFALAFVLFASVTANAQARRRPAGHHGRGHQAAALRLGARRGRRFYQLRFRPSGNAAYQLLGERIPATITQTEAATARAPAGLDGHALHRRGLQQRGLHELRGAQSAQPDARDHWLSQGVQHRPARTASVAGVALSADGYTLAVDRLPGSQQRERRQWRSGEQQFVGLRRGLCLSPPRQRVAPGGLSQGRRESAPAVFRHRLVRPSRGMALSADGSILAVAAPCEDVRRLECRRRVCLSQDPECLEPGGHACTLPQPLGSRTSSATLSDMSHDGRTLKVNSVSSRDDCRHSKFRTHIFVRPANTWQHSVTLAPFYPGRLVPKHAN